MLFSRSCKGCRDRDANEGLPFSSEVAVEKNHAPLCFPLHFLQSPVFLVSKVSNYCRLCQQLSPPGLPPVGKSTALRNFEAKGKKKRREKKEFFLSLFLIFFFFNSFE